MPDQFSALVNIVLAALAVVAVFWLIHRVATWEIQWFRDILLASDEQLAARPIRVIDRDRKRMGDIVARMHESHGITPSRITDGLAAEQYARLVTALNVAARAFHAGLEQPAAAGVAQYAAAGAAQDARGSHE